MLKTPTRSEFREYEGQFVAIDGRTGKIVMAEKDEDKRAVEVLAKLIGRSEHLLGCYVETETERDAGRPQREKFIRDAAVSDDEEMKSLAAVCTRMELEEAYEAPAHSGPRSTPG